MQCYKQLIEECQQAQIAYTNGNTAAADATDALQNAGEERIATEEESALHNWDRLVEGICIIISGL